MDKDTLIGKIGLLAIGALVLSIYSSWSDSVLINVIHLNPDDVFEMGFISRLLFSIFGLIGGVIIGLLGYIPKVILKTITSDRDYIIWSWIFFILATIGGAITGIKFIAHWMY